MSELFGSSAETIVVFKSTRAGGLPIYGSVALAKPSGGRPGPWHDTEGDPVLCSRGVHGCRSALDLLCNGWLNEWLWVAELRGPFVEEKGDKIAGRSGRLIRRIETWNEQTARLFAADCAKRALTAAKVTDKRSWNAIRSARLFAFGKISDAARAAAWGAVRDAAWGAARAAAWAAAGAAARAAAWDAARDAAGDAARAAAGDAARAAAWDAARDAARAAAGAAAGDAAGANKQTARLAAWDAAWGAERRWQAQRLHDYLSEKVDLDAIRRMVDAERGEESGS